MFLMLLANLLEAFFSLDELFDLCNAALGRFSCLLCAMLIVEELRLFGAGCRFRGLRLLIVAQCRVGVLYAVS